MTTLHRYCGLRRHPGWRLAFVAAVSVTTLWTMVPFLVLCMFALYAWTRMWAVALIAYRTGKADGRSGLASEIVRSAALSRLQSLAGTDVHLEALASKDVSVTDVTGA